MIQFWGTKEPEEAPAPIPLTLPQRLSDSETVRLLGEAFDVMTAVLIDHAEIEDVAGRVGYTHVLSEDQTPSLQLQSYRHARDEHRLILNTHLYSKYVRQVLHLTIPGGMTLEAFERFRLGRECIGCTYHWHAHLYGEWHTSEPQSADALSPHCRNSPVFIELRQDVFQGESLLLRVTFHRLIVLS
ncbi:MAG: hypothetical protein ACI89J_001230 [Hyphomicrobiaceae bacterium]|jgi:hypothetical protein